jgi:hypothetical protein
MKPVLAAYQPTIPSGRPERYRIRPDTRTSAMVPHQAAKADRLMLMQHAFRSTGGLMTGDELAVLLRRQADQPLSLLARWIVDRRVISFEASGETWLPVFQFEPGAMTVRRELQQVIDELREVFDDWELTEWFASSNCWLGGVSPSVCMLRDPEAVIGAARADRFVVVG